MSVGNSVVSETLADVVVRAYTSPSPSVKTYFLYPYLYFLHFTTHRASVSTPGFATTHFYLIAPFFLFSFFASDILSILGDFYLDRTIGAYGLSTILASTNAPVLVFIIPWRCSCLLSRLKSLSHKSFSSIALRKRQIVL